MAPFLFVEYLCEKLTDFNAERSRLIPLSVSPNSDESEKNNPCFQTMIWIATRIQQFFRRPIVNLP